MSVFGRFQLDEENKRTDELVRKLKANPSEEVSYIGKYIERVNNKPEDAPIKPACLYTEIVEVMLGNKAIKPKEYMQAIEYGEEIYKHCFPYDEDTPDFDNIRLVFVKLFDENGAVEKKCFDDQMYDLFVNKFNYIKWLKALDKIKDVRRLVGYFKPYAVMARCYFPDEDVFTANIFEFTKKIAYAAEPQTVYDEEVKKLEHMVGIYNVDENRLMSVEQKLDITEDMLTKAADVCSLADERLRAIDGLTKSATEHVKTLCDTEVGIALSKIDNAQEKLEKTFDDFLEGQRKIILYDKDELVRNATLDAEARLERIKRDAQTIVNSAALELSRINKESGETVAKFDDLLKNDAMLKDVMKNAEKAKELNGKLDRLMILNDENINRLEEAIKQKPEKSEEPAVETSVKTVAAKASVKPVFEEAVQDVNPFLDESISFTERYERVCKKKKELEKAGEHFHKAFDDVLIAVMENANPYLIGPSGCGKTYMVGQIARLLNQEFVDIGYINEEYDILGFQTADGGYSCPNFYRCYKYGKFAFCDELDNGNSRATVKLNSFLSNIKDARYSFPNGESVKRHPNFRVIGAGNTSGNGGDANYNTREKIEESVQQRFTPIYVGYDNSVEKAILKDYDAWYELVVLFRAATDAWSKNSYCDAPGIVTTRDVTRIKKYLDNKSFNEQKIIEYEFIQTKEPGYLAFLSDYMDKNVNKESKAADLVGIFSKRVEEIRKNKGARG